jgi:hypothetical protein
MIISLLQNKQRIIKLWLVELSNKLSHNYWKVRQDNPERNSQDDHQESLQNHEIHDQQIHGKINFIYVDI